MIDIGANLTHDSFASDLEAVIQRALAAGVKRMVITGANAQGSEDAVSLAATRPRMFFATAGVHPHNASEYSDTDHESIIRLTSRSEVVAVGECGLDYFRNFSCPDAQREAFERQLEIATSTGLPVFLHQRDAHADFISILSGYTGKISRGVAHCFTGDENELKAYLDLDLYIGITGWICDERRGAHLQEIINLIPSERLMIETDAPYLMPRTLRPRPKSRRNEPAYLAEVLRVVAKSLGRPVEQVAHETTENAERFFQLPPA